MARELAPVGLRSRPSLFKPKAGAAAQPSGSKLPRHRHEGRRSQGLIGGRWCNRRRRFAVAVRSRCFCA
ncbi:hypothetical protein EXW72_19625 [Pseudomonas sp. BCA14]|nr:hypothetical protein EXW70_18365 [Pseudomonas sp. JMN1]TFF08080.1 hypothetical protein EXW71_18965 [Pseudomonas sp. BCA17]TFF24005.1 hypothetical protein EXW72_19625 [Pseudomonas sp. BCA14]TFF28256.1 hypothetical protein EXW73_12625 [Pseudomonas sp. BCA13]